MAIDMDHETEALHRTLTARGLTHLRVTKRGQTLTIVSGTQGDSEPEARLTCLGPSAWRLDLRHHTGRWEQTPFVGTLDEMVDAAESLGSLEDFQPGYWK